MLCAPDISLCIPPVRLRQSECRRISASPAAFQPLSAIQVAPTSYDSGTSRDIRKYLTPPCATLPLEGKLIVPLLFFFCYHSAPVLYKRQYCIVQHCKVVRRARVRLRFLQRNLGNSFTLLKAALLKTQELLHCKPKKLDGSRRIRCVERSHAGILSAVDVRQKRVCLR